MLKQRLFRELSVHILESSRNVPYIFLFIEIAAFQRERGTVLEEKRQNKMAKYFLDNFSIDRNLFVGRRIPFGRF